MIHRVRNTVWLLVCGSLVACGDNPQPAAQAAAETVRSTAPVAMDEIAAVPVGPVTLPVRVSFVMPAMPTSGLPLTLELKVVSAEKLDRLEVLASSTGLSVSSETAHLAVAPVEADQSYDLAVTFTPAEPGITDLGLLVRTESASGEGQARFAVPVLVVEPPAGAGG